LFAQRAKGFQIEFRFRNAPPRPPVGPCFVGHSLDTILLEQGHQYKPHNAVEGNHTWKLHVEADIGVPLAPSAMDERSYRRVTTTTTTSTDENTNSHLPTLHPDDDALLNWTGSMGDTSAELFKRHQEQTRAEARLLSTQQRLPTSMTKTGPLLQDKTKVFSRVLKDDMQTWMKKTTYLSNDYSRKVHDFKSLAQVKSELATELDSKQIIMSQQRSVQAITKSFEYDTKSQQQAPIQHPTNPQLTIVQEYKVLPDVTNWGRAFTHVVMDKIPTTLPKGYTVNDFNDAFITNVEKQTSTTSTSRTMTCNIIVPSVTDSPDDNDRNNATTTNKNYCPIQSYDLDVLPLKDENTPHMNFTLWLDDSTGIAHYIPIASRVQLTMGRPTIESFVQPLTYRPLTDLEISDCEERMAEIDEDMAEKHHVGGMKGSNLSNTATTSAPPSRSLRMDRSSVEKKTTDTNHGNDDVDGENDFGDDDDDDDDSNAATNDKVFGNGAPTIVATES
jgi:Paf1